MPSLTDPLEEAPSRAQGSTVRAVDGRESAISELRAAIARLDAAIEALRDRPELQGDVLTALRVVTDVAQKVMDAES